LKDGVAGVACGSFDSSCSLDATSVRPSASEASCFTRRICGISGRYECNCELITAEVTFKIVAKDEMEVITAKVRPM
jgi:hypothetical protein